MVLPQVPASVRSFRQQAIDMGGIAPESIVVRLRCFRGPGPGIARVANGELTGVQFKFVQLQRLSDKRHGLSCQRAGVAHLAESVVGHHIDPGKPGVIATKPLSVPYRVDLLSGAGQYLVHPVFENGVKVNCAPTVFIKETGIHEIMIDTE